MKMGWGVHGGLWREVWAEEWQECSRQGDTREGLEVRAAGTFEAKKVVVTKGQRGEVEYMKGMLLFSC